MDDQRFAHVGRDPKFRSMPKKYKKVKIDKRFDAMFKDKRFKLKYTVDKRGRPVNLSTSEDLKRYYDADENSDEDEQKDEAEQEEEEEASEAEEAEEGETAGASDAEASDDDVTATSPSKTKPSATKKVKKTKKSAKKAAAAEPGDDPAEEAPATKKAAKKDKKKMKALKSAEPEAPVGEAVREKLMDLAVDYARGGGQLLEDSSSDDESEPEEVEVKHDWAELDREAPRIADDETTARLALCNMDWDRIKAQDIMVLMTSFLPPGGVINEVTIYPSEFGKKQMAEEEERGPPQLFDAKEKNEDADSSEEEDEPKNDSETASLSQMEYVRRYQLSRLRFYYAVVSCDSRQTAAKIYEECEGLEFESSASRVDLRFIPDDMTFEETPREQCTAMPEAGRYRPSQFVTTALQQRLVRFTWDETDVDRQEVVRRASTKGGEVDDADIRAYLADSSSDEQQDDEDGGSAEEDEVDGKEDEQAKIAKYRALLADGSDAEEKPNGDIEMEITWGGLDLKEKTEELVKKKMGQEKETTPWEKYIDKQKVKKKAKTKAQKKAAKAAEESSDSDSDSDIPSDLADDPFFKEELDSRPAEDRKPKKKKAGKGKKDETEEIDEEEKAQLALLTMGDAEEDTRRHFNFKQIVKDEASAGKKRKWKKKRKPAEEEKAPAEDFQVDVADPRFSKLFESASFNVDPSDARFKSTEGMRRLVGEKQRRVAVGEGSAAPQESAPKKARVATDPAPSAADDLGALVNTIKSKTKQLKRKKAKSSR